MKQNLIVQILYFYGVLDCPGLGLMLYQCFHSQLDKYIASHHQDAVALLLRKGQNKVETVSIYIFQL